MASLSLYHRLPLHHHHHHHLRRQRRGGSSSSSSSVAVIRCFSDPSVLQLAEKIEDSASSSSSSHSSSPILLRLRDSAAQSLLNKSWPTHKDEPFRFTDTSFLKQSLNLVHPVFHGSTTHDGDGNGLLGTEEEPVVLPIIDGRLSLPFSPPPSSSSSSSVFVGSLSSIAARDEYSSLLNKISSAFPFQFPDGDLFWAINGIGAPDVVVIHVPAGCRLKKHLHLTFRSRRGSHDDSGIALSNPRVFVVVEDGAEVGIVEEFVSEFEGVEDNEASPSSPSSSYWTNCVTEMVIGEGAKVCHAVLQAQAEDSTHIKWTHVQQGASSSYKLIETSTGGKLSRHNLHIQQLGPETDTELSSFHLAGRNQTQDLHSRLVLDYPKGTSRQLHKCIVVDSSGQAVFDGNIRVNRNAQETNAGQLVRSLLLAPRATVNVKPNLQIVADNVKCSHGASVSDIEAAELLYLRARGVDEQTARNALIFSFAAEVIERVPYPSVRKAFETNVKTMLMATGAFKAGRNLPIAAV